jgi:hypothetical protein
LGGFIDAALSFPTVIFTPLLVIVIGYWLMVVIGGMDPEADGGVLDFAGLSGVPASIPLSLLIVFAWFGSLAGGQFLVGWLALLLAIPAALLLAWCLTVLIRRFLPQGAEPSRADMIGLTCVIRTGRVTNTFGQAEVHARDGSSSIVQVRQAGDDDLRAGSVALLYDADPDGEFFWVVPADIATKDS